MVERRARIERGFTLVELILVIIIVGILGVTVAPRFANRADFDSRGFYDGTLSLLRYAQKSAVAQRREVCVGFTAVAITLTIATNIHGACDMNLTGPNGVAPYSLPMPDGVGFAPIPADFFFRPSGAVSVGQSFNISGISSSITVEEATGYVF